MDVYVDSIIGSQPFDDGYLVERVIEKGSERIDFLMRHAVTGEEKVLRVYENNRENLLDVSQLYKIAEGISEKTIVCCKKRKTAECCGSELLFAEIPNTLSGKLLPTSAVARIGIDICEAIVELQKNGYVHRNIKPTNISYCNGKYFLNSFDLMEKIDKCNEDYIAGTPAFMAPEAVDGICSMTTDTYSLALMMYIMLNKNQPPFSGGGHDSRKAFKLRIDGEPLPKLPHVHPGFMKIISKACEYNPNNRYNCAEEMLEDMHEYINHVAASRRLNVNYMRRQLEDIPEFSLRWQVNSVLGAGSFGAVYNVTDKNDGVRYAMKIIPIPISEDDVNERIESGLGEEQIKAYYNTLASQTAKEALVCMRLSESKNIVKLVDSGKFNNPNIKYGCYFWMCSELLSPIDNDCNDEKEVAKMAADICMALNDAHESFIIHRDIKPANILYSPNGIYKLGDFGVAKLQKFKADATVIGTLSYMAPELLSSYGLQRNTEYDSSVDIYSLGLTMYTMLNKNRGPFIHCHPNEITADDERNDKINRIKGVEFPPAEYASAGMMRIINKACAYEPENRFKSAADMYEALYNFLSD